MEKLGDGAQLVVGRGRGGEGVGREGWQGRDGVVGLVESWKGRVLWVISWRGSVLWVVI
jgi:hypothetical protein